MCDQIVALGWYSRNYRGLFIDDTPVYSEDDVYTLRFPVKEIAWLPLDQALPVDDEECWTSLSFTKNLPRKSTAWTNMVRGNLRRFEEEDGAWIESYLKRQLSAPKIFPLRLIPSIHFTKSP